MSLRRALHLVGTGALTGALLLGSAPAAGADDIRDRQWALDAFDADKIWQQSTGKGVTVAVVDSGVDASHPDLKGQVLKGKDFTKEGGSAQEDSDGHGTAMAGLIAGRGHGAGGGSGVKGLAPDSKILPIRYQHKDSEAGASLDAGVRYAVREGADVINISQVTHRNAEDARAIAYATKHDVVVVAGTGNEGIEKKNYPASYPGVVSVGGVDDRGAVWEDSSWGSNTTLAAPAVNNVVTNSTYESGYAMAKGTSDATAYVSASAALVRAEHPDLTAGQVINRLIKTAKVPGPEEARDPKLPDEKFGYGVVRPYRAVTYDIPAGPKAGPLAQADKPSDAAAGDASSGSGSSSEGPSGWMFVLGPPIVLFGLIFLVLVGVAVLVVVLVKRKDGRDRVSDPWGSGGGPAVPPQQYPGQQVQAPTGQFGGPPSSPPPPPNQPPPTPWR
ncbi:type VII secretion-associated serine protease mycosin [Streptomyces sp. HNM0575]|uniref:type VII secretion-associated serine protease mycosin n=1 Tax=Streptomyces sp. HNM0575 TaxID=2716338 RepID=UPI00145C46D5|nr:type VII secretion-associated serine protease mycosin [Streptomyces sp. HNM0575]NLU76539.1 type VII secretion-associated serine protease mycosin [Streptomyces sp. HNM0575]